MSRDVIKYKADNPAGANIARLGSNKTNSPVRIIKFTQPLTETCKFRKKEKHSQIPNPKSQKMTAQQPQPDVSFLLELSIRDPLPESAANLILSSPPFIPVPNALNLRTLSSPTLLPPNILFRCGSLSHLPTPILSTLSSTYNIKTIFDIRSRKERERDPSPSIDSIETIWIPSTVDIDGVGLSTLDGEAKSKSGRNILTDVKVSDFVEENGQMGYIKIYGNILKTHKDPF